MKTANMIKIGACMICALFIGNAIASESYLTLASSKPEAKETVKSLSDNQLATNVREKFTKEKLFGKDKFADMGIHVTAKKGVVTITGKVSSASDVDKAVSLAKSVDGVKNVVSKVVVKEDKKDVKKTDKK